MHTYTFMINPWYSEDAYMLRICYVNDTYKDGVRLSVLKKKTLGPINRRNRTQSYLTRLLLDLLVLAAWFSPDPRSLLAARRCGCQWDLYFYVFWSTYNYTAGEHELRHVFYFGTTHVIVFVLGDRMFHFAPFYIHFHNLHDLSNCFVAMFSLLKSVDMRVVSPVYWISIERESVNARLLSRPLSSFMTNSRNILKRVEDSRKPCLRPTRTSNQSVSWPSMATEHSIWYIAPL